VGGPARDALAIFNLALLVYDGVQWGWTAMAVGTGISLAIVALAAWSGTRRRSPDPENTM
jgi:O-antigen/teichoic acid export membrane protein